MARPPAATGPDSRERLLAAATDEFAAHGLAGASVDRIARKAHLNKAMIYYHFENKEALYRETIRATFLGMSERLELVRRSEAPPGEQLSHFVETFVDWALRHPTFPRLVMRELVESGRHFDQETARTWVRIPQTFFALLQDGVARRAFRPVHPLVAFLAAIGPTVLLLASAPARARVGRLLERPLPDIDRAQLLSQVRAVALAVLRPAPATGAPLGDSHALPMPSRPAPRTAPRRKPRPGRRVP